MKKYIILLIVSILAVSLISCKKDQEVINTINDQEMTDQQEEVNKSSESADTNVSVDTNVSIDIYGDSTEKVDGINIQTQETIVTDEKLITEIKSFLKPFYYNYLFDGTETGNISDSDMQLFAISFVYQYEYNELPFDAQKFILYIPDKNVTEVIQRFFDYEFINHKKPKNEKISYENGNYLMPACELDDQGDFSITKVTQQTGFSYHVSFEPVIENKPIDAPDQYYEALIEERDGRYIMKSYKKTIVEKDSQEENNQEDTEIPMEDLEPVF